jgi:hypothetical protein
VPDGLLIGPCVWLRSRLEARVWLSIVTAASAGAEGLEWIVPLPDAANTC